MRRGKCNRTKDHIDDRCVSSTRYVGHVEAEVSILNGPGEGSRTPGVVHEGTIKL